MNKTKNIIWIITIGLLCILSVILYNTYNKSKTTIEIIPEFNTATTNIDDTFSDGLTDPDSVTQYELDEYDIGIAEKSIFYADINNDGKKDRIIRTFTETGNAHAYYEYNIELNINGKFVDITPENFRTINGADCDLQQIQFVFKPTFKVILISRDFGETWDSETMAKKQVFKISDNKLISGKVQNLRPVCDVKELF
jgi:hypothetical protein